MNYRTQVDAAMLELEAVHQFKILTGDFCCGGCMGGFMEAKYGPLPEDQRFIAYSEQVSFDINGHLIAPIYFFWGYDMYALPIIEQAFAKYGLTQLQLPPDEDTTIILDLNPGDRYSTAAQWKEAEYEEDEDDYEEEDYEEED